MVAFAQPGGFGDVAGDAYYSEPVAALAAMGVFAGTECDAGFCPGEPLDRKTMAVWVVRILDGNDPAPVSESRFDDVAGWHARFVERMAELGVTAGCGDGSGFCPDRSVSRAQMAVFLSRAYDLPDGPDPGFSDVPSDAWYAAAVSKLAASQITAGCGDGAAFCPGRDTTRAQMATFLYRAENWVVDRAAQQARADVEVNGHDDSINLQVTYDNEEYEATVSWSAPSGTHGQVEHYVLQSRLILEDFGPEFYPPVLGEPRHDPPVPRNQIVEAESGKNKYQVTVSNGTNSNHLYAFRVIVVYTNGKRLATTEVKTPANVHKLRDIIWDKVVEPKQDEQPWLSDVWAHINDSSRFGIGFGSPSVTLNGEYPNPTGLMRVFVRSLNVGPAILYNQNNTKIDPLIHELGHVYTLTNGVSEDSAPIGIGYLYLGLLSANHAVEARKPSRCSTLELYADLALLAFFDLYTSFSPNEGLSYGSVDDVSMGYWYVCGFRLDQKTSAEVTTEIQAITKSVFVDQEIPQWFYDTYQEPDGSIDLEKLWSDINVDNIDTLIVAYHLRNEFGGYCSEEQVRGFIEGKVTGITNPWRDGGCTDTVTGEESTQEASPTSSATDGSLGQRPDIGQLIRDATYGSYRMVFLSRLRSTPDRCWVVINGYVYDVTQGDDGYEYLGTGSLDDLCGQDATERFRSDGVPYPDLRFLKGHLRS